MMAITPAVYDEFDALVIDAEEVEQASEDDLWFLPGPMDDELDYLPPGPRANRVTARSSTIGGRQREARPRVLPVWPVASARWTTA